MRKHFLFVCLLAFLFVAGCKAQTEPSSDSQVPAEPVVLPVDNDNVVPAAPDAAVPAVAPEAAVPAAAAIPPAPSEADIPAPADVAAPPADAIKTQSGLQYKVLTQAAADSRRPTGPNDKVTVHYTGWTTDGKMFDSSLKRGEPAEFMLSQVIEGWTEGVQLMAIGEKARFWIPENLAYKGRPGAPAGMLVFDIELLAVEHGRKAPENVAAAPENAIKTQSGLQYLSTKPGDGVSKPSIEDLAKINVTIWSKEGKLLESSEDSGDVLSLPIAESPAGWKELILLLSKGEKAIAWIPGKLMENAEQHEGHDHANDEVLTVEMELVDFVDLPAPPADVAAAPADALKTASGLQYKILTPAKEGAQKPTGPNDKVKVHYSGWTTDGKMFDSSVARNTPAEFVLSQVIAGWTEGVQLMAIGEKTRFWIPQELAYKGQEGAPAGTLVFDIELLEFEAGPKTPENVAAAPENATKTESGLQFITLTPGDGKSKPNLTHAVKVNFTLWDRTGKMLDSSTLVKTPIVFPVNDVVDGWKELVQNMTVGEKTIAWIPGKLMFEGKQGPQGDLTVEMELIEIIDMPQTPADVAAIPEDAQKTPTGLAFKILKPGTGTTKPNPVSTVKVNYAGWTTDGKMFDTSIFRGEALELNLALVIPGWTEGLQLMVEGEARRFWIPEELAYKGRPGAPAGMLVFDVELVKIVD